MAAVTTNSTLTAGSDSQGYTMTHPGFPQAMHGFGFPPFPAFPMPYPGSMPNYTMPAPMYMQPGPYGYPFAPQGTQATMQPNGYPAPYFMPNYPTSVPTPMYVPPGQSSYPFAMPTPQLEGANVDNHGGRKRQFSVSDPQATSSSVPKHPIQVDETGIPNTDPTFNDWLNDSIDRDAQEA
jgi:hypothetical protein